MAIQSIGAFGLSALEKAQMVSSFSKNQKSSLVSGLSGGDSPIGSSLMYSIYDQKSVTPRVLAAVAAKTAAAEENSGDSKGEETGAAQETAVRKTRDYSALQDDLIAQNRSYNTSDVPTTRPPSVTGVPNVDLTA